MNEADFLIEEIYKLQNKLRDDLNTLHEDIIDATLRAEYEDVELFKELYKAERAYQDDLLEVMTKFFAFKNERYKRHIELTRSLNEEFGYIDTDVEV